MFLYTTAKAAGQARKVVINDGGPVTTVPGATADVPVYATDAARNPAAGTPEVRFEPSSLGTWQNGRLTVNRAGNGVIVARDGHVTTTEPAAHRRRRPPGRLGSRLGEQRGDGRRRQADARVEALTRRSSSATWPTTGSPPTWPTRSRRWRPSACRTATVEPVLTSIAVTGPASLKAGAKASLAATGTAVGGDNVPPLTLPVADPASHVWTSSDTWVVSVDRVTGALTAHRPGTVTVSVVSGGITGNLAVTVTG